MKVIILIFTYQNDLKAQKKIISRSFFLKKLQNIVSIPKTKSRLFLQLKSAFEDFFIFLL